MVRSISGKSHSSAASSTIGCRSTLWGSGVFGFARLHAERKTLLDPWLADPSETVRTFAAEQIRELDQCIAAETRSAEALIAQRKLDHGEELDGDEANAQ